MMPILHRPGRPLVKVHFRSTYDPGIDMPGWISMYEVPGDVDVDLERLLRTPAADAFRKNLTLDRPTLSAHFGGLEIYQYWHNITMLNSEDLECVYTHFEEIDVAYPPADPAWWWE